MALPCSARPFGFTVLLSLAVLPGAAAADPLPLGTASAAAAATCETGMECWDLTVSCPGLEDEDATLEVGESAAGVPPKGTVLFFSGSGGASWWDGEEGTEAEDALSALRDSGFTTVQVRWDTGWLQSASGVASGQAVLACRPATVARWVYDELTGASTTLAFCASGNSAGAGQVAYMLTRYGLEGILDAAVVTSGPPFARIDIGCLHENPAQEGLWFEPGHANTIDRGYGFPGDGTGPCYNADPDGTWEDDFYAASLLAPGGDFGHPNTAVVALFGGDDDSAAVDQGVKWIQKLLDAGSPRVWWDVLPGVGHQLQGFPDGAEAIRDALLAKCKVY